LPYRIATHHTADYHSYHRLIGQFFGGHYLYNGVLYRENITNIQCLRLMMVHQRLLGILLCSVLLAVFVHLAFVSLYPVFVFIKFMKNRRAGYLEILISTFLRDISGIAGFLFFYPSRISSDATRCERLN